MQKFNYLREDAILAGGYFVVYHELFRNQYYRNNLCDSSILLYGILRDRMARSKVNNFRDKYGRVFVMASVEDVMKYLNCGNNKVTKIFKELVEVKLIKLEKMAGMNAKRRIYIGELRRLENTTKEGGDLKYREGENNLMEHGKSNCSKMGKTTTNNTYLNKNNKKNTVKVSKLKEFEF